MKPLNQERRIKQLEKVKNTKPRGVMPPPVVKHKNDRQNSRQKEKVDIRKRYVGNELLAIAKELIDDES